MSFINLKIVLVGDGAVGKTSLIKRFVEGHFQASYQMTLGFDILTKDISMHDGKVSVAMAIWDIGSQDRFKSFRSKFYKGAAGALIVFDLTRFHTFENVTNWVTDITKYTGPIPIILLGNKSDLKKIRAVESSEVQALADKLQCQFFETSAKTGAFVDKSFHDLTELIWEQRDNLPKYDYEPAKIAKEKIKLEKRLVNEEILKILTSSIAKNKEFRFIVAGNEAIQKFFLANLFQVENIVWPPGDLRILYGTTSYKFKSGMKNYDLEIFLLSNIDNLQANQDLFHKACQQADALMIFFNAEDQTEYEATLDFCLKIRDTFPEIEIVLIGNMSDSSLHSIMERKRLKNDYSILTANDFSEATMKVFGPLLEKREQRKYEIDQIREIVNEIIENPRNINKGKQELFETLIRLGVNTEKYMQNLAPDRVEKIAEQRYREHIAATPESKLDKETIQLFISYATDDSEFYQVSRIATELSKYPEINAALYWEKDMNDDIYVFMDEQLGQCDACLLFCSENALESEAVKMEWRAALKKRKKIIPVFVNEEHIPTLIATKLGVPFNQDDIKGTIEKIYKLILKKFKLKPQVAK